MIHSFIRIALLLLSVTLCVSLVSGCKEEKESRIVPEKNYLKRRQAVADIAKEGLIVVNPTTSRRIDNMNIYYLSGQFEKGQTMVFDAANPVDFTIFTADQKEQLDSCLAGQKIFNPDSVLVYMRAIKEPEEIEALREAVSLTARGLQQMLDTIQPGMTEREMLDIFKQKIVALGSEGASFGQVAAGSSAASPHAPTLDEIPAPDEMFVVDVGALKEGYTGDITICFTLSGEFSEEQQTIYDIIYKSLEAAVAGMVAGNNHAQTEKIAMDIIMDELYALDLVTDLNSPWQRSFWIQHGFGHHIGLDVHDVWYDYIRMVPDDVRVYLPNMVLTIEPGIYFSKDALQSLPRRLRGKVSEEEFMAYAKKIEPIYEKYKGIAVRLEENILIKADGTNENLSKMILK